jgi:transcriptional regulator with XRE-family HTH domain
MTTGQAMSGDRADLQGLGTFIRERRRQMGLTQTQLGRRIGYYQERISALERGTYGLPSLPALEELTGALECELVDLLCACGYMEMRTAAPVTETAVREGQLRDGVQMVYQGMGDLQRRLSATETAMYQMVELRDQMRQTRQAMNAGMRECLKSLS